MCARNAGRATAWRARSGGTLSSSAEWSPSSSARSVDSSSGTRPSLRATGSHDIETLCVVMVKGEGRGCFLGGSIFCRPRRPFMQRRFLGGST